MSSRNESSRFLWPFRRVDGSPGSGPLRQLDGLAPRRNRRCEAEGADFRLEGRLCRGIAMHDESRARLLGEVAQPGEELRLVGVCGESADRANLAADLEVLRVYPHLFRALLLTLTECVLTLIADAKY